MSKRSLLYLFLSFMFVVCVSHGAEAATLINNDKPIQSGEESTLLKIQEAAKEGKLLDRPFSIGSSKEEIEILWGKPTARKRVKDSNVSIYNKKNTVIIFDDNENAKGLIGGFNILLTKVENTLGEPSIDPADLDGDYLYDLDKFSLVFGYEEKAPELHLKGDVLVAVLKNKAFTLY